MILDELDKAEAGADQSIPDVLLNLLEPRTARSFTDEALDWPVDASNMLWITMANDLRKVSDPLLSRFSVIGPGANKGRDDRCDHPGNLF